MPVSVTGLAEPEVTPGLFHYVAVADRGHEELTLAAGERTRVEVSMLMHSCEFLFARAGSFATEVSLHTRRAGVSTAW